MAVPVKTMVVEDDTLMREVLELLAASRGHEVYTCENATEALEAYGSFRPQLALVDWMMDGMDGLELCRRMRQLPGGEQTVILVVTARNQSEDLRAVLEAGADDYITKPIDAGLMEIRLAIAEQWVAQRRQRLLAQRRLEEAMARLEESNRDLLTILDGLGVGTVLTDAEGRVTFLNRLARDMLQLGPRVRPVGAHWSALFRHAGTAVQDIEAVFQEPGHRRERISVHLRDPSSPPRSLEVAIHDDPRGEHRKILALYDVTEVQLLRRKLGARGRFGHLIGKSAGMEQVFRLIQDVAQVDTTVLIEGDTGTGKELVARSIHEHSARRKGPFIAVNCAGLTDSLLTSQLFGHRRGAFTGALEDRKGFFEAASGGTIFLDEIGDIPMTVQTALLRVLQEREIIRLGDAKPLRVDVRVIAATHRDLAEEVAQQRFRADLLYRIRVARITIPPLRERREDIPLLAMAFLEELRAETGKPIEGFTSEAMGSLMAYDWPGNVRELRSAVEFALIRCHGSTILPSDLPPELAGQPPAPVSDPSAEPKNELEQIRDALRRASGNRSAAARLLGWSRATLYRRLARYRGQV